MIGKIAGADMIATSGTIRMTAATVINRRCGFIQ